MDYSMVGVVANMLYKVGQPAKPTMYFSVLIGDSDIGGLTLSSGH
ncbi:MAG TPA: hypothetical protein VM912_16075 [Terriglobales bacterium]|nr:hypothetical protein [Terriglobales bacterium]